MQKAAEAYGSIAKQTVAPRELEASLLVKAAVMLQTARDDDSGSRSSLDLALDFNRRLWTVFASAVADPESPLPREIRNNIASLSVFIFDRTMEAISRPAPDKLSVLIAINREIAAGLRSVDAIEAEPA